MCRDALLQPSLCLPSSNWKWPAVVTIWIMSISAWLIALYAQGEGGNGYPFIAACLLLGGLLLGNAGILHRSWDHGSGDSYLWFCFPENWFESASAAAAVYLTDVPGNTTNQGRMPSLKLFTQHAIEKEVSRSYELLSSNQQSFFEDQQVLHTRLTRIEQQTQEAADSLAENEGKLDMILTSINEVNERLSRMDLNMTIGDPRTYPI